MNLKNYAGNPNRQVQDKANYHNAQHPHRAIPGAGILQWFSIGNVELSRFNRQFFLKQNTKEEQDHQHTGCHGPQARVEAAWDKNQARVKTENHFSLR